MWVHNMQGKPCAYMVLLLIFTSFFRSIFLRHHTNERCKYAGNLSICWADSYGLPIRRSTPVCLKTEIFKQKRLKHDSKHRSVLRYGNTTHILVSLWKDCQRTVDSVLRDTLLETTPHKKGHTLLAASNVNACDTSLSPKDTSPIRQLFGRRAVLLRGGILWLVYMDICTICLRLRLHWVYWTPLSYSTKGENKLSIYLYRSYVPIAQP